MWKTKCQVLKKYYTSNFPHSEFVKIFSANKGLNLFQNTKRNIQNYQFYFLLFPLPCPGNSNSKWKCFAPWKDYGWVHCTWSYTWGRWALHSRSGAWSWWCTPLAPRGSGVYMTQSSRNPSSWMWGVQNIPAVLGSRIFIVWERLIFENVWGYLSLAAE